MEFVNIQHQNTGRNTRQENDGGGLEQRRADAKRQAIPSSAADTQVFYVDATYTHGADIEAYANVIDLINLLHGRTFALVRVHPESAHAVAKSLRAVGYDAAACESSDDMFNEAMRSNGIILYDFSTFDELVKAIKKKGQRSYDKFGDLLAEFKQDMTVDQKPYEDDQDVDVEADNETA